MCCAVGLKAIGAGFPELNLKEALSEPGRMRAMRWAWAVAMLVLLSVDIAGGEEENMGGEESLRRVREHELATYSADCMACNALQVGSMLLAAPASQQSWQNPPSLSHHHRTRFRHISFDQITPMIHAASGKTQSCRPVPVRIRQRG